MTDDPPMRQEAPYPAELADLVSKLRYRPGWTPEVNVSTGRSFRCASV